MPKLTQEQIVEACNEVYHRYARMTVKEAHLHFAYELQGYMAWLIKDTDRTMPEAESKIMDLMMLFKKVNPEL